MKPEWEQITALPARIRRVFLRRVYHRGGTGPMTAERAMGEIWALLCPDCGPDDHESIFKAVEKLHLEHANERQRCIDIAESERQKILGNSADPSWTEHLADVQTRIRFPGHEPRAGEAR